MICKKCNNAIDDKSNYCTYCGEKIIKEENITVDFNSFKEDPKGLNLTIIGALLIVQVFFAAYIIKSSENSYLFFGISLIVAIIGFLLLIVSSIKYKNTIAKALLYYIIIHIIIIIFIIALIINVLSSCS